MSSEVHALGHFASSDREEDSAPAVVAGLLVVLQGQDRLEVVFGLDVDQLVLTHSLQYSHFIPLDDNMLHVFITSEEAHNAIRYDRAQVDQQAAIVPDIPLVLSLIELTRDGQLVHALGHNHGLHCIPGQHYVEGFHGFRLEI